MLPLYLLHAAGHVEIGDELDEVLDEDMMRWCAGSMMLAPTHLPKKAPWPAK